MKRRWPESVRDKQEAAMRDRRFTLHPGFNPHHTWSSRARRWPALSGVALLLGGLSGCGVGSSALPAGLSPSSSGFFSIRTTTLPNAIAGRSYTATIATSAVSPAFVSLCTLSGSVPVGMTATESGSECVLSIPSAPAAGTYNVALTARDNSTPPRSDSRPYTLVIRSEFRFTTTSLADGVQGRSYGTPAPLSQPEATNVGATAGNGPLTACNLVSVTPFNPGLALELDAAHGQCLLSSNSLAQQGTYTVTITATDSNISVPGTGATAVKASTISSTLTLTVNSEISFSLNFDSPTPGSPQSGTTPDAVVGRPYGAPSATSLIFSASGGLVTSTGLTFSESGALPTPINCPAAGVAERPQTGRTSVSLTCGSGNPGSGAAQAVTASPGAFPFAMTVGDPGNAATPPKTVSADTSGHTSHTINVDDRLSLTSNLAEPLPNGVQGRGYGSGAGCTSGNCTPVVYGASNGLGTHNPANYAFLTAASSPSPASAFPQGMACLRSAAAFTCSATNVTGAAGTYTPQVSLDDTGNATTPSASASGTQPTPIARHVTIAPPLSLTPPAGALAAAVAGRRWGVGSGCLPGPDCSPATYGVSGGLGGYTPGPVVAGPMTCGFISTGSLSGTYVCSSPGVRGAGSQPVNLIVSDTANVAVPSVSVSDSSRNLVVFAEMTVVHPPVVPPAVVGRRYGTGAGCSGGNCAPLAYSVPAATPGLGGPYVFTPNNFPVGFTCPASSNNANCQDSSVGGSAGTLNNLTVTVTDTANASTPNNSVTSAPGTTLQVNAEMSVVPPGTVPPAVLGRRYGTGPGCSGGNCAPLVYTVPAAKPGLGGYTFTPNNNFPAGFTCPSSSNNGNCQDSSVGGSAGTLNNLTVTATDTANASTPNNSVTSAPATTLQVNAEMTVTPPSTVPPGVVGRRYGTGGGCSGGNCAPLVYTVPPATPGLGGYTFTPNNFPAGFTCPTSSNNGNCQDSSVGGSAGTFGVAVNVTDAANVSTPSGSVASSPPNTLQVNAGINLTQSLGTLWPDGIQSRTYGTGSTCGPTSSTTCSPAVYAASNGLGNYVWPTTPTSLPTGFTCSPSGTTYACTAPGPGGISGAPNTSPGYKPSVTVIDTANTSTPAATTTTDPNSTRTDTLPVDAPLAIGSQAPPNGLVDFTYSPASGFQLTTTGGLPGLTWLEPGSTSTRACTSSPTGTIPPGLAVGASSGLLSGTPTQPSSLPSDYTFQVCVTDTANATSPAGFALPPNPPFTGNNYVVNVLDTLAYAAEPNLNAVEVIRTSNSIGTVSSIGTGAGSAPDSVALTPNGRQAYATLANNRFAVIDTITNAQITGSPFSLPPACTGPKGVAISPDGARAYFACSTSNEVVVIRTADNTTVVATITATGSPTPNTPDSVACKSDGTRAYVTFSGSNQIVILDNTASPPVQVGTAFALTPANPTPLGIALATNESKTYAYIAKQNPGAGNRGAVDVVDVTTDTLSIVTNISRVGGNNSQPDSVAVTPDETRVFVTLTGADQFAVLDNTVAPPVQISGSPFNLPDPASPSTASAPIGVTIPPLTPVPASGFRVFISRSAAAAHDLAIIDSSPPAKDSASPIDLGAGLPSGIAHIPPPK